VYWLTKATLRSPAFATVALIVVTIGLLLGLPRLHSEYGYRPLLGGEHAEIQQLEKFIDTFAGGFPLFIVWQCETSTKCQSALDRSSLEMAFAVESQLEYLEGVVSIRSPATSSLLVPNLEGFEVRRLAPRGVVVPDIEELALRAVKDPLWSGNLVSSNGKVGAIIVYVRDSKSETMVPVVAAVREAIAPFEADGFEFSLAGHPIESVVPGILLEESTAALTPLVAMIVALIIFAMTRSWQSVGIAMATMGVALLWTFGILGWTGWPQDSILQVLANLVLIVGICDAIHLLSKNSSILATNGGSTSATKEERRFALLEAARQVSLPCLLTTLTTGGAFLSFTSSDLATFGRFGLISAIGVVACLVLTFSLLPLLVNWLPADGEKAEEQTETWAVVLGSVASTAERRAIPILATTLIVFVVCLVGWIGYLRVDTDINRMWGEHSQVSRWIRFVDENLRGLDTLEIEIVLPIDSPIEEPETQVVLAGFIDFLEQTEGLGATTSVQDLLKTFNRMLHNDDPDFERPGGSAAANGEMLELISFDDPGLLQSWLSIDRSRIRISVEGPSDSASGRGEVLSLVRDYVDQELPKNWEVVFTGPFAMEYVWVSQLQSTQLRSFAIAFLIVFVMSALFLRSASLGLAALVPAVVPVVVVLGIMGLSGLLLDVGRAMVAAIVLGIAVDDSLHLLSHFRACRLRGMTSTEAMRESILHVGRAVVVTSLAVALGSLALVFSAWQTLSSFGFFVSIALIGALAASLFVLPAIIFLIDRGRGAVETDEATSASQQTGKVASTLLVLLAIVPPIIVILGSAASGLSASASYELPCWILANGRVMPGAGTNGSCPLGYGDELLGVGMARSPPRQVDDLRGLQAALELADATHATITVLRDGQKKVFELPVTRPTPSVFAGRLASASLISGLLLFVPLVLLRKSTSPATRPLAFFYSALSVIVVVSIAGRHSRWLQSVALVAGVVIPATLAHLAFTFPVERRWVQLRPALVLIPYVASACILPSAWVSLHRYPGFWPAVVQVTLFLALGAWVVLATSCMYAVRESIHPIERARSKTLLYGFFLLPLLAVPLATPDGRSEAFLSYMGSFLVLMPVPIAYGVSRYDLFYLGFDVRKMMARAFYVAISAIVLTVVLGIAGAESTVGGYPVLFAIVVCGVAIIEGARGALLGFAEGIASPEAARHRDSRQTFIQKMGELRDEDDIAGLLGATLRESIQPTCGCVFLYLAEEWRPVSPFGEDAASRHTVASAAFILTYAGQTPWVSSDPKRIQAPEIVILEEAGVEIVLPLRLSGKIFGQVLLGRSNSGFPYSQADLDLAAGVSEHAALALHNADLARGLLVAEKRALSGRLAVALFHRMGKELAWIRNLSNRLPDSLSDRVRTQEDLQTIGELSDGLVVDLRSFMRTASIEREKSPGMIEVDAVIEQAIVKVEMAHGSDRILYGSPSRPQSLLVHEHLRHVLEALLDNALLATFDNSRVHISAEATEAGLEVTVSDSGSGMDSDCVAEAFRLGYTTRSEQGGSGVGLAISREIVESLGGMLTLHSELGRGTRAVVRVPLLEHADL
jgi:predicted RND superfamily exporter protein/signal transduction histidine kinase